MNSGSLERRMEAARERTRNLVDASVRDQIPEVKCRLEVVMRLLIVDSGVESMVAMVAPVAGLRTGIFVEDASEGYSGDW